jgi:hypothetical protein
MFIFYKNITYTKICVSILQITFTDQSGESMQSYSKLKFKKLQGTERPRK